MDCEVVARVQQRIRTQLIRHARGFLDSHEAKQMLAWAHGGGFSLDASVQIPAHDREGLERLIRYCARPAFAHERLRQIGPDRYRYDAPKPGPEGNVSLIVSPLELLDRLAALIPPPGTHRHRYFGCLAPNVPLCAPMALWAQACSALAQGNAHLSAPLHRHQPSMTPRDHIIVALERLVFTFDEMVAQAYERGKALSTATLFETDDVIDPADTRSWILAGLRSLPQLPARTGNKRLWVDTW